MNSEISPMSVGHRKVKRRGLYRGLIVKSLQQRSERAGKASFRKSLNIDKSVDHFMPIEVMFKMLRYTDRVPMRPG